LEACAEVLVVIVVAQPYRFFGSQRGIAPLRNEQHAVTKSPEPGLGWGLEPGDGEPGTGAGDHAGDRSRGPGSGDRDPGTGSGDRSRGPGTGDRSRGLGLHARVDGATIRAITLEHEAERVGTGSIFMIVLKSLVPLVTTAIKVKKLFGL
jgi:hypothetical protein